MSEEELNKIMEKEFKKIAKNKFLSPQNCTQLNQTRGYIFELTKIIKHFEKKFNHIPDSAQLLFNEYDAKQEKMLFEKYKDKYLKD